MKWISMLLVAFLVVCGMGCGVEGLHNANPQTVIKVDPVQRQIYVYNNKDVDIDLQKPDFSGSTKSFKADSVKITDNASKVREANGTYQMLGMAAQATANWQGATNTAAAIAGVLREIMPYVPQSIAANALGKLSGGTAVSTPWGQSTYGGLDPTQVEALKQIAGSAIKQPTTQPVPK